MNKLKNILKDTILESKDSYNTPAAISKEKSIGKKKVKPEDSITDLDLNTLNRNHTIKEYRYGPMNPDDENGAQKFWEDKAAMWDTTVEHAKTSRCSNCAAFDKTPATLKKIADAIGEDGKKVTEQADLGFCELFWFKCAGARTCDAWIGGGPITK